MNKFIAIEGVIGVGKTTLTRYLKDYFNASVLLEVFEENPFLADFYSDRDRYAFQTQLFFLLSRYQQQNLAVPEALAKGNLLADYTFAKDELFAWLNLKDDELAMYGRVHSALGEKIRRPDLLVYLTADHEIIMQRIAQRDRPYERDMDPDYIKRLSAAYEEWLSNLSDQGDMQVLKIDVSQLDFIARPNDVAVAAAQIEAALAKTSHSPKPADENPLLNTHNLLPSTGALASYQNFHNFLDKEKEFDPDLFYNYILLVEEMGELARDFTKIWTRRTSLVSMGMETAEAHQQAIRENRTHIGDELADLMAYILKLANYVGVDLEQAYIAKMMQNVNRHWEFD
ncbi:MAG: deoxyguanosine kinase [Cellvibrionaceae bacterium]|jgi:deoxyguanosine kinase